PKPVSILEIETVEKLVSEGCIVITVGGGGIPVVRSEDYFEGVAAVIDKDRASARLALDLKADMLVILTAVDKVSINFNKPEQKELDEMSLEEARKYIEEGHFAKGSMLPKVESCIEYVQATGNGKALITSLEKAKEALQGKTGTIIHS
ncbi:MAG: carbamate kinase, partial [Erysipelotrichaceae bacterium]|nr:carbamate kinase [Erysipelotrichaceae bacterium]